MGIRGKRSQKDFRKLKRIMGVGPSRKCYSHAWKKDLPIHSSLLNTLARVGSCIQSPSFSGSHYPVMTGLGVHTQVKDNQLTRYERSLLSGLDGDRRGPGRSWSLRN